MIIPDWPAPPGVNAISTTRVGGVSTGPWSSFNLGSSSGDSPLAVSENRSRLEALLPSSVNWLSQVHGTRPVRSEGVESGITRADAVYTGREGVVCAVLSADCLPVLLTDLDGSEVAAAHAGWRGLAGGVLERTVSSMHCTPEKLIAWMGPCIGPEAYEVGEEVRHAFVEKDEAAVPGFRVRDGAWLADLYFLARLRLESAGVSKIYGAGFCTYSDPGRFFSYRRDGITGRMATVIWKN